MSTSRLAIGVVRRGYSDTGGAEAYLKRLARGLSEAGHSVRLFTDAAWPAGEWGWGTMTRLRGDSALRFADEIERSEARKQCDLLLSLERIWSCDVYRAGDGIHQAWLQHRSAVSSFARRLLIRCNVKHRETLELEKALFRGGARRVIANSEMVKAEAQQFYGYPAEQIDVVRNGVPLAEFQPDPEMRRMRRNILRLRDEDVAVLFVGSGWERKGLRFATEAVNSLGKNFRLLIAGRGRRQIARGRFVQRLGPVRDLRALYSATDIFLLPTLYDPFSNASLEALAAGLPVITTRRNGCSEIIQQNVHGTILDHASNTAEIRDALVFWSDRSRREQARPAILERASHFDISANVEHTLAVLRHLANADAVSGKIRKT